MTEVVVADGERTLAWLGPELIGPTVFEEDVSTARGRTLADYAIVRVPIYLGEAGGRVYAESMDASNQVIIRIVPGVLRAWDFADEYVGT